MAKGNEFNEFLKNLFLFLFDLFENICAKMTMFRFLFKNNENIRGEEDAGSRTPFSVGHGRAKFWQRQELELEALPPP